MQPVIAHSNTQIRFICRDGTIALVSLCLGLLLSGCGNVLYTYRANSAASKLEEARQAGAEKTTLYEYTLAQEHLNKAMSEASEADYGDAYDLAKLADQYAEQALEKARLRMRAPVVTTTSAPAASLPEAGQNPELQATPAPSTGAASEVPASATTTRPTSKDHEEHQ